MQNFCGKCGAKLSSELKFCTNCGAPIQTDVETAKEEIPTETKTEEATRPQSERIIKKDPIITEPSFPNQQSIDPKIKKTSILIIGLFISLILTGALFNYPIRNSLNFDYTNRDEVIKYIEVRENARKLAEASEDWDSNQKLKLPLTIYAESDIQKLNYLVNNYFPLVNFNIVWRITLFITILIILTFSSTQFFKDPNMLKWIIILLTLILGIIYSFLVTTNHNWISIRWGSLEYYLSITASILICLLAFYGKKGYVYWILVPTFISLIYTMVFAGFANLFGYSNLETGYLVSAQLTYFGFYLLKFLGIASYFILPSIAFYLFLKDFVYTSSSEI